MATLDAAGLQLAESLLVEQVPARLRCGSCNKLAVNAVRLPCCDQSICERCSQDLPEECPVCSHSPVSAEDCNANKSLRMTIKAFIKSEEKKRSKDAEPTAPAPASASVRPAAPIQTTAETLAQPVASEVEVSDVTASGVVNGDGEAHKSIAAGESQVGHDDSTATVDAPQEDQNVAAEADPEEDEDEEDEDDNVIITTERPEHEMQESSYRGGENEQEQNGQDYEQSQINGQQNFGYGQNQGFGNMDFNAMNNFNPMMAMQGGMGMPNFGMNMANMMGMPGMGMDPSMMFNGGFGGMGGMNDMSMMNMGMGMNGMGNFGGMPQMGMNGGGAGFYPGNGGYNNQQNFGSHINQNFHNTRGYGRPYNRGNFGRGGRGYYGGRGRGGWQNYGHYQGQNQNVMNQQFQQQQNFRGNDESYVDATSAEQGVPARGSPSYAAMDTADGTASDINLQKHPEDAEVDDGANNTDVDATNDIGNVTAEADGEAESSPNLANGENTAGKPKQSHYTPAPTHSSTHAYKGAERGYEDGANVDAAGESTSAGAVAHDEHTTSSIEAHDPSYYDQQYQQGYGYGSRGRGGFRGGRDGFRGARGGAYGYVATPGEQEQAPTPAPPVNAPTGPKAMRQGLPNSGWYSRPTQAPAVPTASAPTEVDQLKKDEHVQRGRSRSRSRSPRNADRKDRQRSPLRNKVDESDESDIHHRDRDSRKRKERDEDRRERDANSDGPVKKARSRDASRDDDQAGRRHRDRDEDHHTARSYRDRSRDRRKHRNRSRSPDRDASVNGDSSESARRKSKSGRRRQDDHDDSDRVKDRESNRRHSRREDDREYESKDRSKNSSRHARSSRDDRDRERDHDKRRSAVEEQPEEIGFKIRGQSASMKKGLDAAMGPPTTAGRERSDRRSSVQASTPITPTTPALDPYEADRIEAQKKREKAHNARRQSTQSTGKRSREDDDVEVPTGPRGDSENARGGKRVRKDMRRHSAKFEGEIGDGHEDRDTRRWR